MILGGLQVVDLRRPGEAWGPIGEVIAIAIHHTVSDFDIEASNDLDSIAAILRWHKDHLGWPGIGYHLIVGDDGTVYYVGDLGQQRAHIEYRNHEIWGVALLGSYQTVTPPPAQIDGTVRAIHALRQHAGRGLPWDGHKNLADPRSPTACPGDRWPDYQDDIAYGLSVTELVAHPDATELALRRMGDSLAIDLAKLEFQQVADRLRAVGFDQKDDA